MCTPSTMTMTSTRLVRFRVRDLASCFLACRFPLGDETDRCAQVQVRNLVYDDQSDSTANHISNKKMSRPCKKCRKRRQLNNGLKKAKDGVSVEKRDDESCIQFVDEDFIVFCFGENQTFDLVKDDSVLQPEDLRHYNVSPRSSKPGKCKKKRWSKQHIYCDHESGMKRVTNEECRNEGRINARINNGGYEDFTISETKEGDMLDIVWSDEQRQEKKQQQCAKGVGESQQIQTEESENGRVTTSSLESRDSNQSDCSTGSFTFPVLGWELIGSPAPMPKSEEGGQHPHHHKLHPARFQCCKF